MFNFVFASAFLAISFITFNIHVLGLCISTTYLLTYSPHTTVTFTNVFWHARLLLVAISCNMESWWARQGGHSFCLSERTPLERC